MLTRARATTRTIAMAIALAVPAIATLDAQQFDLASAMHWRMIGPTRAGRARAVSGVASEPNVAYIGFDNGGVWRTTDYGSNWEPIFDKASTGSIGAIAVAPSDPNVIYVGTGAGIIRPDLAIGDGVYKSTDAGKTWTNLGLPQSQMIAQIDVDPKNPNRFFVAVLGHPYGPNPERGVFRSTDGGKTFEKVLYKDEYTSANDVRIDPSNPNIVYAALWEQQQSFIEGGGFGGNTEGHGIFKSVDGGTTWKQLTDGLPQILQANLAIAPSNPKVVYAMVAATVAPAAGGGRGGAGGGVGFYKSTDGGEHWHLAFDDGKNVAGAPRSPDNRPLVRIGGGDLPTIAIDPKNENVIYSSSTVFWRTEDAGITWSAVRGAPGGDDYQKTWINPINPDILVVVADQGGVISGNRGKSWSNWYNQPTAAMYHVSTDNAFPYRVCGGQQDSGSACVDSRSMDGEITFHDWHPVNIQEYGVAASDPRDPDQVFGSQRSNVSLYNRKTGQTTTLGPDMAGYNRNVRTMPINWSPVNPDVLFYASNAVWKTANRGHSWTRISPDLTRQHWQIPASAGKYASTINAGPAGSITALSPSPRDIGVLWAGTDDGNIQVTMNGGAKWSDVTPAEIKPWTRIFNIEAGHFDTLTAYAAANTLRIDDQNPHLWRTHDGGKTWTEISRGLTPGSAANSIREDPRKKGLLFASTESQVWVSYNDGDNWQSLKLDMPVISVRDIQIKDDATCKCSDLIAATHGRGFYILDNITPLRQAAEFATAQSASTAHLFKPAVAMRIRFATNDPTPWPPEVPAGENPSPGALIDYFLPANTSGAVKIEVLDNAGKVVRTYSSDNQTVRGVDPAADPAKYNTLCQQTPTLPDCGLPLYWPAPQLVIGTNAGMHRFNWDLRFDPINENAGRGGDGAVPHRTYTAVNAPWAIPGAYSVRLTVDGHSYSQPITVVLDPRVKMPAVQLAQLSSLSREMYDRARQTEAELVQARSLQSELAKVQSADVAAFKLKVDSLAPAAVLGGRGGRGFGRGGAPATAPTLESASNALLAAAMAMQSADVAPTANQIAACTAARAEAVTTLARWTALKTTGLRALNAKLKASGQSPITLGE
jgi:photosystem II stability/assembly factor-like uncharacterized protein